jgi:two-component system, repressor protein LuxO
LAHHFLSKFSAEENKGFTGFDPDVMSLLRRYDWPGNVRQLENVVRNVVVLNSGATVTASMLPTDLQRFAGESLLPAANQNTQDLMLADAAPPGEIKPLWMAEKEAVMKALDLTRQDITQAAALLEVSPSTLYRKLQAWKAESAVA